MFSYSQIDGIRTKVQPTWTVQHGKDAKMANEPIAAAAVANAFLDIQDQDTSTPGFPRIDPMKLQKLLFYSQAWWLALKSDTPLFREEIYAWPWGPVISNIYQEFRDFGSSPITNKRAKELVKVGPGPFDFCIKCPPVPNEAVLAFLKSVWDKHKIYTGVQLSNATHSTGEPWTIVKEKYGSLESKPLIPNELISEVFKAKINNSGKQ